jgi:hypothetical protein
MGNHLIPRSKLERELTNLQRSPELHPNQLRAWLWKVTELSGPALVLMELFEQGQAVYVKYLVGAPYLEELRALGSPLLRLGFTRSSPTDEEYALTVEWARAELVELLSSSAR